MLTLTVTVLTSIAHSWYTADGCSRPVYVSPMYFFGTDIEQSFPVQLLVQDTPHNGKCRVVLSPGHGSSMVELY